MILSCGLWRSEQGGVPVDCLLSGISSSIGLIRCFSASLHLSRCITWSTSEDATETERVLEVVQDRVPQLLEPCACLKQSLEVHAEPTEKSVLDQAVWISTMESSRASRKESSTLYSCSNWVFIVRIVAELPKLEQLLHLLVCWEQILALSDSFESLSSFHLLIFNAHVFSFDHSVEKFLVDGLSESALTLQVDWLQNLEDH